MGRIEFEKSVIGTMIRKYCSLRHERKVLCDECAGLLAYSRSRLDSCPFGDGKRACSACSIRCYRDEERERIREVMRTVGPRMIYLMPRAFIRHVFDSRKRR